MTPKTCDASFEDPRLFAAVQEYLSGLERGRPPSRQELLGRHPEIARELAACLDGLAFVHSAAPDLRAPSPGRPDGLPSQALGDYRLVREIGRGGMGVVYEAEQVSLGRRVAVKVLPLASALDDRRLLRFKNEAHAVAQLQHPNIVPVYGVGCEEGVHFYAMQLIEGQSLADLIGRLSAPGDPGGGAGHDTAPAALAGAPARTPAYFRAVARLGVQAAEALEYAHQMGVVHRDVKPANLLLDGRDNVWLTDFGLAQFRAGDGLTGTGMLLGTLRYMSPEQARGKGVVLDPRTDVYSLGVTLYELLTLEPAFPEGDPAEVLSLVAEEDPPAPRLLDRAIPRDLETVVLKAVAKAPEDRYATARDLADDLRRFLEERPIHARRPTLLEGAVRWSRRHRSVTASAAVVLVLAVAGSLLGTLLLARAYQRERAERGRAERTLAGAQDVVDFYAGVGEDLLPSPDLVDLRRKMLEAALTYYRGFIEERQDDRSARDELEQARERVASLLEEMSALERLGRTLTRTLTLRAKAVQEDLGLSPAQAGRLAAMREDLSRLPKPRELRRLSRKERKALVEDVARAREAALADLLTPQQDRRLREIDLQVQGPFAFTDGEAVQALGLTEGQRQALRALQDEARFEVSQRRGDDSREASPEEFWGPASRNALAQLTPEQRARWKGIVGEPFRGKIRWGVLGGLPGPAAPHEAGPTQ